MNFVNRIRVAIDRCLMLNFYRIPFLPYELTFKYDFPTKRLVRYCFDKSNITHVDTKIKQIAHAYAYDSTVTKDDLSFIHDVYGTSTRERVRQILAKFIRTYYK